MTKIFSSFVCRLKFTVIDTMKCGDEDNDRVLLSVQCETESALKYKEFVLYLLEQPGVYDIQ